MTRVLATLAALLCALEVRAALPACRAEVLLEPLRAVAGEQVLYRVRVLRRDAVVRVDWALPPVFPSARLEALPPEPRADVVLQGVVHHVHDEVRALFPERLGALALGGAVLRCELAGGEAQQVAVPEAVLRVEAFPEAGRPQGFAGLVGPLLLHLTVTPERVELGKALRVAVLARGAGNLWLLDRPFPKGAFGSAEVFERPAALVLERGNGLFLRQHLALDLVPRAAGPLRVPALAIPYFDPVSDTYRVATTEEVQVLVQERAAVPWTQSEPRAGEVSGLRGEEGARSGWLAPLAAALVVGAGIGAWRWRRRGADAALQALQAAAAARKAGDLEAEQRELSRALRSAIARHVPEAPALAAEELAALPDLPASARAAVSLLCALERARFERGAPAVEAQDVARALRALDTARHHAALGAQAVAGLLLVGTLGGSAFLSGCASPGTSRDEPMTPARLEAWLRDETRSFEEVEGQLRFLHGGVRMICLHDVRADRMRLVATVTQESALTVVTSRILLQANFGNTLDARYAIRDGMLYAVYLHPLSTLAPRDLEAALDQVAHLVRNFGTTFSAAEVGGR